MMYQLIPLAITCLLSSFGTSHTLSPQSAEEIVARALEAHGGAALSSWKTMVIKGEVKQKDLRLWFRGEYILYAQKPDKLRVEKDLTKFERGRFFFSEIYNSGKGWMVRNLVPVYRDELASQYKARLDRCDGMAFYTDHAESFLLKGEEEIQGRPTYVIEAALGEETATLHIDKESFYLVQEAYQDLTLIYSEFKTFGDTVRASRIREIKSNGEKVEIEITYHSIDFDVPIDPALFEEDMPSR
jgi:hypothetical protein